jgi:hypothetical protein
MLAMTAQARAVTYAFLGFHQTDWFYSSAPPHDPSFLVSAADLAANNPNPVGIFWMSQGSAVRGTLNHQYESACGLREHTLRFSVWLSSDGRYLGEVVIGHLAGYVSESPWKYGDAAWNGVYLGSEYGGVTAWCNKGPHIHLERGNESEWINCCGQNNAQQAALRWTY